MFEMTWRNKFLTLDAKNIDQMAAQLRAAASRLESMAKDGVTLAGGQGDDYARLVTTDPAVAKRYGMHEEEDDDPHSHDHGGEG